MINQLKKLLFKIIYKVYLWSSKCSGESFLGSRSVEYPFAIEELRKAKICEGSKILLVGCAGDPLSTILPALGYETYGIDLKHVAIKYPNFHFVKGDIRKTTFPDDYFDAVIAISTIEHVGVLEGDRDGDRKAMREISRIVKQGGIVIVTCPLAFKSKITRYERVYDLKSLDSLLNGLVIMNKRLFKKDTSGYWMECMASELSTNDEAVCLISAVKGKV